MNSTSGVKYDYIIVGAGPGGLQMGHLMEKAGKNYIILERNKIAGSAFVNFPRHRTLISINKRFNLFPEKEFNMRHDWNSLISDDDDLLFTKYADELFPSADILVEYLQDYASKLNIQIKYGVNIKKISRMEDVNSSFKSRFRLVAENGDTYECRCLLMATGPVLPMLPDIPGLELADTYASHSIDQKEYENKVVNVVGAGNSGLETANHLAGHAGFVEINTRGPIRMAWDSHFVGNIRAVNNNIIDMWHLKSMHFVDQFQIKKISKGKNGKLDVDYETNLPAFNTPGTLNFTQKDVDKVILCTGFKYVNPDLFDESCQPETYKKGKFVVLNNSWESTVPDMFFIGTSMQSCDRRAASGFIHGYRYNICTLFHILQARYHNTPLPCHVWCDITTDHLTRKLVDRASTTSALYQMGQGFLCDLYVLEPSDEDQNKDTFKRVTTYPELRQSWLKEQNFFFEKPHTLIATLEDSHDRFGDMPLSAFVIMPDMTEPSQPCSGFIRPVFRLYSYGQLVDTLEMNGNPVVRCDQPQFGSDNYHLISYVGIQNMLKKLLGSDPLPLPPFYDEAVWKQNFRQWTEDEFKKNIGANEKAFRTSQCINTRPSQTSP